ncbi:MAG: hypothetical protein QXK47_02290 [Candidatus Bathyarchaeia archaeon]
MATNITVYIGSLDVSSYVRDVYVWRRQNRFQIKLWNPGGILSGVIAADALVQVYLDGLPFYKGYVDNVQPTIRETDEACFEHTLLVSGRDVSQDMWNKVWDKIYHGKADDIIADILTNSGCEVTFSSPSTAPTVYYDCRQMFVGDAVREILELVDYDGFVDWNKQLHVFPIGTVDSGITLRAVRGGTDNNIIKLVEHVEKDATDLKNYIIVLGGPGKIVDDAWTEHTADAWQISPSDKWVLEDVDFPSELGGYLKGIAAIKARRTQTPSSDRGDVIFKLTFPKFNKNSLDWSKIDKEDLTFITAVKATVAMTGLLKVRLKDVNNKIIYLSDHIPGTWGIASPMWETPGSAKPQVWVFPVGKEVELNTEGSWWRGDGDFNWNVKEIEIVFCGGNFVSANGDKCLEFYLDGLVVPAPEGESPIIAVAQDPNSQQLYKVRKAFYNKKDVKSQVLLQQFADSLLNKRKNPLERLRLLCLGSVGKISGSWNWILGANVTVNIPDENINNRVYRMIEIVHRLGIETMQTYGYDHVVELSLVPYDQPVDLTRWSYETGEIGIFRILHERLTFLEQEKSERRDWFSALPSPLAVRTEDVKIPIYQPVFGRTAADTTRYAASANQLVASKFSLTTSYDEKPAFIGVYVKTGTSEAKLKAAVYSDNNNFPLSLLDWSEFVTVPANFDGQVTIPLTQNTHLSTGDYWLAVWASAPLEIYCAAGSSKTKTVAFNGFPDPFPSDAATLDYVFSVYHGIFTTKAVAQWQDKTYPDKISGSVVVDEMGTDFPSNPFNGQRFYRTDIKAWFRYDAGSGSWIPAGGPNIGVKTGKYTPDTKPTEYSSGCAASQGGSNTCDWADIGEQIIRLAEQNVKYKLTKVTVQGKMSQTGAADWDVKLRCMVSVDGSNWQQFGSDALCEYTDYTQITFTGTKVTDVNQPLYIKIQRYIYVLDDPGQSGGATVTVYIRNLKDEELISLGQSVDVS